MKVKPSAIGLSVYFKGIGYTTIEAHHGELLAQNGKYQFLEGVVSPKKLVALKDKTVKQLEDIAQDLDGYKKGMKKDELLKLINAAPSA